MIREKFSSLSLNEKLVLALMFLGVVAACIVIPTTIITSFISGHDWFSFLSPPLTMTAHPITNTPSVSTSSISLTSTSAAETLMPTNTFTAAPVSYPTPIPPTLTVEPPIIPTIDTRPTDTTPGTVLQIGETWTTQGFSVQLRSLTFAFGDEADLEFVLTNNTGRTLFFHFSNDTNVVMKDDLGRIYNWATPYEYDMILENGSYDNLRLYKGGNFSGIQYLIITVDLPSLIYAQWKN